MYVLTFTINNKLILATTDNGYIRGYNTLRDVLDDFASFKQKWTSGVEAYGSATICMMNTHPVAVEFGETIGKMKEYIIDGSVKSHSGLGYMKYVGCEIDKSFLENRKTVDIWRESMIEAGIYDPLQSEITDPFPFTF